MLGDRSSQSSSAQRRGPRAPTIKLDTGPPSRARGVDRDAFPCRSSHRSDAWPPLSSPSATNASTSSGTKGMAPGSSSPISSVTRDEGIEPLRGRRHDRPTTAPGSRAPNVRGAPNHRSPMRSHTDNDSSPSSRAWSACPIAAAIPALSRKDLARQSCSAQSRGQSRGRQFARRPRYSTGPPGAPPRRDEAIISQVAASRPRSRERSRDASRTFRAPIASLLPTAAVAPA